MSGSRSWPVIGVVGAIAIAVGAMACGGGNPAGGQSTSTPVQEPSPTPAYQDIFSLRPGTCFNPIEDMDDEALLAAQLTSCNDPHAMEVFAVASLGPDNARFPDDRALASHSESLCDAAFERYVGLDYERSALEYYYYPPTEEGWLAGDHDVMCAVVADPGEVLSETVAGSRR